MRSYETYAPGGVQGVPGTSLNATSVDHIPDVLDEFISRLTYNCERLDSILYVIDRTNQRLGVAIPPAPSKQSPIPNGPVTMRDVVNRLSETVDLISNCLDAARTKG